MTKEEKLQALFRKAAYHGWKGIPKYDKNMGQFYVSGNDEGYIVPSVIEIIFNHDFAKALFGKELKPYTICWYKLEDHHMKDPDEFIAQHRYIPAWQHHLQQAVISDDPIGYMYGVVFDEK